MANEREIPDHVAAHRRSSKHRSELMASERCGCFFCLSFFAPAEIRSWLDGGQTAQCPRCGTDSVIGSGSGYPMVPEFLKAMRTHWFGPMQGTDLARQVLREQPYRLLFATISGAHLYGFPSPDSDYDLRGVHILPAAEALGLGPHRETIELNEVREDREFDLVTHDAKKFFLLMLKKNGYVLEQLYSSLVLFTSAEHEELKAIGRDCITRHHAHHYFGFAETQWKLFERESPRQVKPLLYVYRVLLTGIHLMRTGRIEANLVTLNQEFKLAYVGDLVARKLAGPEKSTLDDADLPFHQAEYERLRGVLEEAQQESTLPERATAGPALSDLLVRLRLSGR